MSNIQISELNNASLEVLNQEETTAVVGGDGHKPPYYPYTYPYYPAYLGSFNDNSVRTNIAAFSAVNSSVVKQYGVGNYAGVGQGINIGFSQS